MPDFIAVIHQIDFSAGGSVPPPASGKRRGGEEGERRERKGEKEMLRNLS